MCLIAISKKGTNKYNEFFLDGLVTSSKTNKDGIGYAFKKNGENSVFYRKGFSKIEDLIEDLKVCDLKSEDELIIHLRRTSAGDNSSRNNHPFIITSTDENIDDLGPAKTHNSVLFHNGHFKDFVDPNKVHSDTYMFVKNFMRYHDIISMLRNDKVIFEQLFKNILLLNNKLAFIVPQNQSNGIITIGDFIEENGFLFSNLTYKSVKITDTGGTSSINNVGFLTRRSGINQKSDIKLFQDKMDKIITTNDKIPDLVLNLNNYREVILEALVEDKMVGIEKDSKWTVYNLDPEKNLQCIHLLNDSSIFAWVNLEELLKNFKCRPTLAFQKKYSDYFRLKNLIVPTKTSIKKINNRIKKYAKNGFPVFDDLISIEYKNRWIRDLRYDSVCMFLYENVKFLNGVINVNIPKQNKEILVDAETELGPKVPVNLNKTIKEKLTEFRANKALEAFKKERQKELDFTQVDNAIKEMEERTNKLTSEVIGESDSRNSWRKDTKLALL